MGVPTLIVARTDAEAADLRNLRRTANFALAVDSVRDPVTNAPICRVALTVANSGCVPINLFGEGAPSQQARAYVLGTGQLRPRATLDNGGQIGGAHV